MKRQASIGDFSQSRLSGIAGRGVEMPKPPPKYCDLCGEQPPNPRHYPLVKVRGEWLCKRCRDNEARDRKEAAKHN